MGKQSSRLYYQGKDHKDIYFQGKYHKAMYLGSQLLWKKLQKIIPYVSFDGKNRTMCIRLLFVDEKATVKIVNLAGEALSDLNLVRGDNAVGYFMKDSSWVFSENGQDFIQTERMSNTDVSGYLGYALTKSCFLGVVREEDEMFYWIRSRDIKTYESYGVEGFTQFGELVSGYLNPKLDIFIEKSDTSRSMLYYVRKAKDLDTLTGFELVHSGESTLLGVSDSTIYVYVREWYVISYQQNQVHGYNYITNTSNQNFSTIEKEFYLNIIGSFYKNGKFIVYYRYRRENQLSGEGRLKIYETTDFMSFTEVETPHSIVVKDMDSDGEYTISFDSEVSGDVFLMPYCNLDNTYYFDEEGVMHDNDGCLFTKNINEKEIVKTVTIYFDNYYFRQSDNNFCQILIYKKEQTEEPLS